MRKTGNNWIFEYFISIAIISLLSVLHFPYPVNSFGAEFLCSKIPGLTPKQRTICENSPDAIAVIGQGSRLGITECQHQFRYSRWNCTPIGLEESYGHVVVLGSREAAFLYAISSAGVTYAITQACARGNISTCGCAPPTTISTSVGAGIGQQGHGRNGFTTAIDQGWGGGLGGAGGWRWGGCSADVDYGIKFARKFMDSRELEGDARSLMNVHNNKAGRKAVQSTLETECKCHGVSGSCTLKTCWLKLSNFRQIGDLLLEKYKKAKPVVAVEGASSKGPRSRRSLMLLVKAKHPLGIQFHNKRFGTGKRSLDPDQASKPRRSELVFLEQSPNYCDVDPRVGSLGTKGRRCLRKGHGHPISLNTNSNLLLPDFNNNSTSLNSINSISHSYEESCEVLCCGRGYNTHQIYRKWKCNCKFKWCCEVQCQNCQERVEVFTCN